MLPLPSDAPAGLTWFVAWVGVCVFLLLANRELRDDDGQLRRESDARKLRGLDDLNEYVQRGLATISPEDPLNDRPVGTKIMVGQLFRLTKVVWHTETRYQRFQQLNRMTRVTTVICALAALPSAGIWWIWESRRAPIAYGTAAEFGLLLLAPILGIIYQLWIHFILREGPQIE